MVQYIGALISWGKPGLSRKRRFRQLFGVHVGVFEFFSNRLELRGCRLWSRSVFDCLSGAFVSNYTLTRANPILRRLWPFPAIETA
jgi:hypothetical protein